MANQEQPDILEQGVEEWNKWRKEHADIRPVLIAVDFSFANLGGADLSGAHLTVADLSSADLTEANLSKAYLGGANLSFANLGGADFTEADLNEADLRGAKLAQTNLTEANIGATSFGAVDLSGVKGLETVRHEFPSTIGIDTIYMSHGNIPEAFLKGAGVDDAFITYIHSLVGKPIEYHSCFISYSSRDETFAKRLYADLQNNNVRCWFAPEDLKIGDKIRSRIGESIRMYDRLLIVLSEHSVSSKWVEFEVEAAMDKEQEGKSPVLFPVRLDNTVMESATAWAAHIKRTRNIGDFTHWKNHDNYQKAFTRLLRDLKPEA